MVPKVDYVSEALGQPFGNRMEISKSPGGGAGRSSFSRMPDD